MAEHQQAEAVQLRLREAGCVGVVQNVGAVLVVVAVRDPAADFMQLNGPAELAQQPVQLDRGVLAAKLAQQQARHLADPQGLRLVDAEPARQPLHGGGADVGFAVLALQQVVQRAMAQRPLRRVQLLDLQQVEHCLQHADAAADHGPPVVLDAVQAQLVGRASREQAVMQPRQARPVDDARRVASRGQHVGHRADGAGRAVSHVPFARSVGAQRFVQHGLGGHFGPCKRGLGELAVGEVLHGPGHTAHPIAFRHVGGEALAQDQLGRAAANVHHQPALVRLRQQVGHALIDQARFFPAGNHVNRKAQDGVGPGQESVAVARLAQGLGGDGANLGLRQAGQAFAEPRQAVPAPLHRFVR